MEEPNRGRRHARARNVGTRGLMFDLPRIAAIAICLGIGTKHAHCQAGWSWIPANAAPSAPLAKPQYDFATDSIMTLGGSCGLREFAIFDMPSNHWQIIDFIPQATSCYINQPQGFIDPWNRVSHGGGWTDVRLWRHASDPSPRFLRSWSDYYGTYSIGVATLSWDGAQSHQVHTIDTNQTFQLGFTWQDASTSLLYVWRGDSFLRYMDPQGSWTTTQPFLVRPAIPYSESYCYWDSARRKLVLSGIQQSTPTIWELDIDSQLWTERNVVPPGFTPREGAAIGYHEGLGLGVFFGGRTPAGEYRNDVWHYDGSSFYQALLGTAPARRTNASLCYHPPSQSMILWGGQHAGGNLADTWRYRPSNQSVAYDSIGAGCRGNAATSPVLFAPTSSLPFAGQPFTVNVRNLQFTSSCFVALGFSDQSYNGAQLPMDLSSVGMPGCTLYTSLDNLYPTTNILGTATWTFRIPPGIGGSVYFNQAFVLDPGANQLGLLVSNAARATVGY